MPEIFTEDSGTALDDIRDWFASKLGRQVLYTERQILDQLLDGFFGYHLLQVSVQQQQLYQSSPIQHKFSLGMRTDDKVPMIARTTLLPFEDDSIDVILLHHLLDFLESPLETLREVSRVALPMGYLVIIGFNPISSWGLWKLGASFAHRAPWFGHFIRPGRLMDWLDVLNYKIDRAQYCLYRPPVFTTHGKPPDYSRGLSRVANLPFGSVYIIVARKQKGAMTPIRPVWRSEPAFGQLGVVRPLRRDLVAPPREAKPD
ncbi:MAG: methyltransferase domain-containing protein [Proteobacteria bacterium]|nr:methyltransferase domain-containing protein [Pseudomonadota bacterium]MDA1299311.1 methyltransferase domain-containing protein [Pseudomonadota bacterium]